MSRLKLYAADAVLNIAAQIVLLTTGCIAVLFWISGTVCWSLIVIGYSIMLAHGCEKQLKKGADFMHYLAYVMLPANIFAAAVSCAIMSTMLSAPPPRTDTLFGVVIWAGSVAITVISVLYNRVALHSD